MKCKKILAGLFGLGLMLSPICVYADENNFVAQSTDGNDLYADIDSAWQAARNGKSIELMSDWELSNALTVNEGETVTIEMNGHKMTRNLNGDQHPNGEVIYISKNGTLNLNGNNSPNTCFTFAGFNEKNETGTYSLTSGGLVTGGSSSNGGGGIHMKEHSTLNLNHVAVAGNSTKSVGDGGGINANNDDCTVNMYDSIVSNNRAGYGAGIYVGGENVIINMENSSINNNYTYVTGGGIHSNKDATYVCMNKNSKIINNYAKSYGGGIFFDNPYCQITSGDGLAEVSNNSCGENGGGVRFATSSRGNTALVKNITFSSNSADGWGGAIYFDQNGVTLENCKFNHNSAEQGGAVYLNAKNTYFTNCTFEENKATNKGGAIYNYEADNTIDGCTIINNRAEAEGGGIYQYESEDITLYGVLTIKDNKRGDNNADDLMLQKTWIYTAYVKGEVKAGSSVGIRTGDNGETQIGKDITSDCSEYFFLNDSGNYHISYENGTLQKRSGSLVGSIFGNENLGAAVLMMVGIFAVGVVILFVNKNKYKEV